MCLISFIEREKKRGGIYIDFVFGIPKYEKSKRTRIEKTKQTVLFGPFCICRVNTSKTWKIVKSHFQDILTRALFPHLCHTEADQELWEDDQQEYIKEKLGMMLMVCIF